MHPLASKGHTSCNSPPVIFISRLLITLNTVVVVILLIVNIVVISITE